MGGTFHVAGGERILGREEFSPANFHMLPGGIREEEWNGS